MMEEDSINNELLNQENKTETQVDFQKTNKYLEHKQLSYKKKLYLGEFIVERFIQIVAFVSIAAIIAIFFYVFKEATYSFQYSDKGKVEQVKIDNNSQKNNSEEELKPESYSAGTSNKEENLKPETYSADDGQTDKKSDELKPEKYEPEQYKPKEYKPEQYSSEPASSLDDKNENIESNTLKEKEAEQKSIETEISEIDKLKQASLESESAGNETEVGFSTLFGANSYIDDEPTYVWQPISQEPKYSLIPLFLGSLKVTLIGILFAAPIAILAAIYTVAFASRWLRELIKPAIEILAGFPSVVIGFFCLITLASVIQELFGTTYRLNSFVGGIGMALAVIPIIYTVTEDALSAVPKYLVEASLALGASKWQTAYRVILPAATPGVFAAIILGFGRAFGETMIALMATGNAAMVSVDFFESVRTMAATIGAEMAEVEFHSIHYGLLFLIGSILFVVTFSLNAIAEFYVRKRLIKRFQGN